MTQCPVHLEAVVDRAHPSGEEDPGVPATATTSTAPSKPWLDGLVFPPPRRGGRPASHSGRARPLTWARNPGGTGRMPGAGQRGWAGIRDFTVSDEDGGAVRHIRVTTTDTTVGSPGTIGSHTGAAMASPGPPRCRADGVGGPIMMS